MIYFFWRRHTHTETKHTRWKQTKTKSKINMKCLFFVITSIYRECIVDKFNKLHNMKFILHTLLMIYWNQCFFFLYLIYNVFLYQIERERGGRPYAFDMIYTHESIPYVSMNTKTSSKISYWRKKRATPVLKLTYSENRAHHLFS